MQPPTEVSYTPISAADAVIRYAGNFVPSWAGAIAIDLLPAVLVFILMVSHGAIRTSRDRVAIEDQMTVAELRAAMIALREVEGQDTPAPPVARSPEAPAKPTPIRGAGE